MSEARIQIVDEHDAPLRGGTMDEVQLTPGGLWHRIARVMCTDGLGNYLLQRRGQHEFSYPGCWDTTISGHVDEGENYLAAALREGEEEAGLTNTQLTEIDYYTSWRVSDGRTYRRFNKLFQATTPSETALTPNPDEVEVLQWFSRDQVVLLAENHPERTSDGLQSFVSRYLLK